MKVSFYQIGSGLIMASFTFDKFRLRVSTGDSCKSDHWSQDQQQVTTGGREINYKLKKIEQFFLDEHRRQENEGIQVNLKSMKQAWFKRKGIQSQLIVEKPGILKFYDDYVLHHKYTGKTIYVYQRMKSMLEQSGVELEFARINEKWYNKLREYMESNLGRDTSAGVYIKSLKHLLNAAFDKGVSQCIEQKKSYFKMFAEPSDQIYLSLDDGGSIASAVIDNPVHAYYRDMFVLTCYTGFRFSDWTSYRPENIVESGTILKACTAKTGKTVYIPLHPVAREILSRHFKSTVAFPPNPTMNAAIKRVCREVGMTDKVSVTYTHKGVKQTVAVERCEMVSCHTARRTFATNAYLAGVPVKSIMHFTGHSTMSAFERYLRMSSLESAINSVSHPFFT
jgi:integrase